MNDKDFQIELTYQVTMLFASELLTKGIISMNDYNKFHQQMQKLYYPLLSKYMDEKLDK